MPISSHCLCFPVPLPAQGYAQSLSHIRLWSHGLQPTRFLCPWDFPSKNAGVGCHVLLQETFPTQGSNQSPALADRFFTTSATWEAQPKAIINLFALSMVLAILDIARKCDLLCLTSFPEQPDFQAQPHCSLCQTSIPVDGWIICYRTERPHFVNPLFHRWKYGLFPLWGAY